MKFFIDTANLAQIREANEMGVLDGVTTNPSLMAKENIRGEEACRRHYLEICSIVDGDVSAEVIATDFDGMVREGEALAALHKNIVVKLPCTADGIRAVKYFAGKNIRTNCTLVFSVGQALLAAKAGATYVSPFVGRLDDICENGVALVAEIVRMYRYYGYDTQEVGRVRAPRMTDCPQLRVRFTFSGCLSAQRPALFAFRAWLPYFKPRLRVCQKARGFRDFTRVALLQNAVCLIGRSAPLEKKDEPPVVVPETGNADNRPELENLSAQFGVRFVAGGFFREKERKAPARLQRSPREVERDETEIVRAVGGRNVGRGSRLASFGRNGGTRIDPARKRQE